MYMSALRELLIAEDPTVLEVVLPNLTAFRAIRQGKDILVRKKVDLKKEVEKLERSGKKIGDTVNVTAFQPADTNRLVAPISKSKGPITSKSPGRGTSPMKLGAAEEKKAHHLMQQSSTDFSSHEKELER